MTISSSIRKAGPYTGNGVTTSFPFSYKVFADSEVVVTQTTPAGVESTLELTTDYTVSLNADQDANPGGSVEMVAAPDTDYLITLTSNVTYSQGVTLSPGGGFYPRVISDALDRATILSQQLAEKMSRAVVVPVSSSAAPEDYLATIAADKAAAAASAAAASVSETNAAASEAAAAASESAAAASQSAAATSAANAATSETNAGISETNAAASETNAASSLSDALAIYGSIAAVAAAEAAAAASASAAQTAETNAETAETNAAASAAAASSSETAAAASYTATANIYGDITAVQNAAAAASASASAASGSADTATNQAAAAAASALSAASVVAQDLSAIDKTVFSSTTLVAAFLYDTAKDSDGGAWRKRCAHTSWEAETLSGNWLGSAANETAARAISGATTGSYYYDTTAIGFYTLNAGSGKTATYRGNVRQFPAQVLITVEAARVILWDITQAGCPMWMVFTRVANYLIHSGTSTAVAMRNGVLVAAATTQTTALSFVSESGWLKTATYSYTSSLNIANRNTTGTLTITSATPLVNAACNAVAMTVLHGSPVDVATGLPVPTIAVATDGNATYSTSVIKDDGTVVNIASDSTGTAVSVAFDDLCLKVVRSDGNVYYWNDVRALTTGASPSATVSASTTPAALGTASKQAKRALSSSTGLTLMRRNQLTLASSMLAYITKDYNSGWMPGDIRGAWLADTTAETLVGAEMITNGDFSAGTTGWTAVNGAGLSVASGEITVTNPDGAGNGTAEQSITTVVGKNYTVRATARVGTSTPVYLVVGSSSGAFNLGASLTASASNAVLTCTFTAVGTTTYIGLRNTAGNLFTGIYDNVSCRLAVPDRSVKAKGLQVFGSVTKAAVASGAALMGYSGFSAANYLEQPYNSDLDFGTGDFCIMGWAKFAATAAKEVIFCRDSPTTGKLIRLQVDVTTSYLSASAYDGTTTRTATGASAIDDATWKHVVLTYSAGTLTIYVNGVSYATATGAALLTLNNATAVCDIGVDSQHANPATNGTLALWRAGATVPTAEQIKHIYETEKRLFEASAQCCLAGTSNAVTALAYDDETDLLHVGTSYGRSAFKGLVRVASEATPVGSIVALAAGAGIIAQAGATAVDVYVPAYSLREELNREAEQMAKFGQNLIAHDFDATAAQTTFTLPVGWEIVGVYAASGAGSSTLQREGTGKQWTRSFDGFRWSAVFASGRSASDWVSILAKRV